MSHYNGVKKRHWWLRILVTLVVTGILGFGILEGIVLSGARTELGTAPDVMVILGAQVKANGPSVLLRDRLDAALLYLADRPELPIIVTGGQGPDEPCTEAVAMRDYLVKRGVEPGRISLEEESHNTSQNFQFTRKLLEEQGYALSTTQVLVVSNGFHLARARLLAERNGLEISTLAAPASHAPSRIYSYLREAPGLVKSWVFDR